MVIRHGQTLWSANHRHTSYTDLELTPVGERQARALAEALAARTFAAVLSSPRRRAVETAELAGLRITDIDGDLAEWHYGEYEGLTTVQIREIRPGWDLWTDGCTGGESPPQVSERVDRALGRIRDLLRHGDVAVVSHGESGRSGVGVTPRRDTALPGQYEAAPSRYSATCTGWRP